MTRCTCITAAGCGRAAAATAAVVAPTHLAGHAHGAEEALVGGPVHARQLASALTAVQHAHETHEQAPQGGGGVVALAATTMALKRTASEVHSQKVGDGAVASSLQVAYK